MAIDRTNLEIEMKCYISLEQYDLLMNKFNAWNKVITQINHYFDTNDEYLSNNHIVLRIRQKGHQYKLTSKIKNEEGVLESHVFLSEPQAIEMLSNGFDASIINLPFQVNKICELTTHRFSTDYKNGKLFIDKSEYEGNIDYEIEFEITDKISGEKEFFEIINEFGLTLSETKSKFKRALEASKEKKTH